MKFIHYFSEQRLINAFSTVVSDKQITASKDRYTREKLSDYYNKGDYQQYYCELKNGYKPRKYSIIRENNVDFDLDGDTLHGKLRIICKPSIYDRPAFLILKNYLSDRFKHYRESGSNDVSIKKIIESIRNHVKNIFLSEQEDRFVIIKTDIISFYSIINRDQLLSDLQKKYCIDAEANSFINNIFIKYKQSFDHLMISNENDVYSKANKSIPFQFDLEINKGVPQGLPVSSILGEMYIDGIEEHIKRTLRKKSLSKIKVYRYVDDIVIIAKNKKDDNGLIRPVIEEYNFKELKLNPRKTTINNVSRISKEPFSIFGFDFFYDNQTVHLFVSKARLSSYINDIEKAFSDFKIKLKRIKRKNNLENLDKDKRRENYIVEYIHFRNKIDKMITGYIVKKNGKNQPHGWIHYFNKASDAKPFKLIDTMVAKFKKRIPELRNIHFKSALLAYRYTKNDDYDKNFYIPNIDKLKDKDNSYILDEFLYKTMFIKQYKIKTMDDKDKIKLLDEFINDVTINKNYIDIERGKTFYVSI